MPGAIFSVLYLWRYVQKRCPYKDFRIKAKFLFGKNEWAYHITVSAKMTFNIWMFLSGLISLLSGTGSDAAFQPK